MNDGIKTCVPFSRNVNILPTGSLTNVNAQYVKLVSQITLSMSLFALYCIKKSRTHIFHSIFVRNGRNGNERKTLITGIP